MVKISDHLHFQTLSPISQNMGHQSQTFSFFWTYLLLILIKLFVLYLIKKSKALRRKFLHLSNIKHPSLSSSVLTFSFSFIAKSYLPCLICTEKPCSHALELLCTASVGAVIIILFTESSSLWLLLSVLWILRILKIFLTKANNKQSKYKLPFPHIHSPQDPAWYLSSSFQLSFFYFHILFLIIIVLGVHCDIYKSSYNVS
jgi:hypothetical protein